jgi:hypothetical protein
MVPWRRLTYAALAVAGLAALLAGGAYASDYGLEARVVDKRCAIFGPSSVSVETKLLGIGHTAPVPYETCAVLGAGNFIVYHVRSGRTSLYESEGGACLYDTVGGPRGCPP